MTDKKSILLDKIATREARIGVVGIGYVGLPLVVAFANAGFHVTAIDISNEKVTLLNRGKSYIEDVPDSALQPLIADHMLHCSTNYADLVGVDAISICVPTPLRKTGDPDISYIVDSADKISALGATGKLIILESTTYPGTTDEIILPRLIHNGDEVGEDVFVAFSPERVDPGRSDYTIFTTPKVIGGVTQNCRDVAVALYSTIVEKPVPVSSTSTAEMVKLLENTFRAVNIGLVNEVALMCDKLGLDTWEVVEAAATKPYGFMPFYPGPGLGGHCIPIDPIYLSWKLRTLNYTARFIELAAEINGHMPDYVVTKITDALNDAYKSIKGSKILVLGVAYKPNVSDVRESPAIDVILLLQQKGAEVVFHDHYVDDLTGEGIMARAVALTDEALQEADCVVIITHHDAYNWSHIAEQARLIVDTRHVINKPTHGQVVYL